MKHEDQVANIKLLMSRLDAGVNVDAGGHRRNPMSVYVDEDLADRERRQFFGDEPLVFGLSGDLPEPGSFLTSSDIGTPILATRGDDGRFRAFVNSCRHRGVAVVTETRGTARRFTCPFHSWTYDTGGALVGVPKQDHFGEFDLSCHGLVELPSLEEAGLLWVHPRPDGTIDLDATLGAELRTELESWDLGRLDYLGEDHYDVACNWKLAMDTFGETYHFSSLHKDSLYAFFYGNVQCYDTYGRNHRMLLCRRDIDLLRDLPERDWDIRTAALPVYWLFPNVQLMPNSNGLYLVRAFPDPNEPGRHVSRISFYLWPETRMDEDMVTVQRMVAQNFAEIIRDEDYVASASQQNTAASGAVGYSMFGRNEPALHHYHNTYRRELGMEPLPLIEA
ncbi:MAG: aromatic ring-hydroxylating dioxygenase subunit alpha [Actinomycetota bacterium]